MSMELTKLFLAIISAMSFTREHSYIGHAAKNVMFILSDTIWGRVWYGAGWHSRIRIQLTVLIFYVIFTNKFQHKLA